jgi:hypothetical protein
MEQGIEPMNDFESVCIVFECEAPGHPQWCDIHRATVEIEIGAPRKDYVGDTAFDSILRLRAGEYSFEVERVLYGYEIRGFSRNLQKLHETLEGSVRLQDWDGEPLLCFTVVDRGRGRVAVGGRFAPVVLDTTVTSEDRFVSEACGSMLGIVVAFEGLSLDQSYLKAPLSDIQRFVFEHRAQCDATGGYPPLPS